MWQLYGLALLSSLALGLAPACAADQTAMACPPPGTQTELPRLIVTATGARRVAGNVTFTVYGADPRKFLAHHGSIGLSRVMLAGTSAEACFVVSAPGTYAVAVYHDENNNHHFDRTLVGLPAEGYGFSNDAPALLGLPSFDGVKFTVKPGETRISIKLRY
jgi:uncharacterized protein (DUF2141 family)